MPGESATPPSEGLSSGHRRPLPQPRPVTARSLGELTPACGPPALHGAPGARHCSQPSGGAWGLRPPVPAHLLSHPAPCGQDALPTAGSSQRPGVSPPPHGAPGPQARRAIPTCCCSVYPPGHRPVRMRLPRPRLGLGGPTHSCAGSRPPQPECSLGPRPEPPILAGGRPETGPRPGGSEAGQLSLQEVAGGLYFPLNVTDA